MHRLNLLVNDVALTRESMAVFFIKYLRTLGFDVTNKEMEKPDIGGKKRTWRI